MRILGFGAIYMDGPNGPMDGLVGRLGWAGGELVWWN